MKKTYFYFLVPLVALAVFAGIYWRYSATYEARMEAVEKVNAEKKRAKAEEEAHNREKAIKDALAQQEKRHKEKAEREAKQAAESEARERAAAALRKAQDDSRKIAEQVRRLQKDVDDSKKEIAKIEEDRKALVDEQAFLRDYVKKAAANTQSLTGVLERIDAADRAAEANARAAAAAKKS
jgi:small-conductance mechanosensitive channel